MLFVELKSQDQLDMQTLQALGSHGVQDAPAT
jgi:hypothetical protein